MPRKLLTATTFLLVFLAAWLVFGLLIVPRVIGDSYRGESLEVFNAAIERIQAKKPHSLHYYIERWNRVFVLGIFVPVVLLVYPLTMPALKPLGIRFFNRFVGFATPQALGAIRFWIFMILAAGVLWEDLPSIADLPAKLRGDMGIMALFHAIPGWESIYANYYALTVLKITTVTALISAMVGFKTRWSVPCGAFFMLIHGGILREYTQMYHTGLLPFQVAVALSFMPCGDGFSFDRYLRKRNAKDSPTTEEKLAAYGWSRYVCWGIVSAAYVSAGLCKIRNGGLWWWHGVNLKKIVLTDTLSPMQFEWGLEHELALIPIGIYSVLGLSSVLAEALYGVVLFSRRARLIIPLLAIGLHVGILFCQGVFFFDLILIQAIFFDLPRFLIPSSRRETAVEHKAPDGTEQRILHQKHFAVFLMLMLSLSFVWGFRFKKYPLSAWQVYSQINSSELITYKKIYAVFADGRKEEAHPEDWIGALADTRHRFILMKDSAAQMAFFEALLKVVNRDTPEKQIVGFEVVTHEWNFLSDADNPEFGSVKNVVSYSE